TLGVLRPSHQPLPGFDRSSSYTRRVAASWSPRARPRIKSTTFAGADRHITLIPESLGVFGRNSESTSGLSQGFESPQVHLISQRHTGDNGVRKSRFEIRTATRLGFGGAAERAPIGAAICSSKPNLSVFELLTLTSN